MMKKIDNDRRSILIGTAVIVVAMTLIFGAVFAWMYSVDLLFLPDFVEDFLGLSHGDDDMPHDYDELSAVVKSGKNEHGETVVFEITYENLKNALLAREPARGFCLSADIGYYKDGEASVRRVRAWRDDDRFRAESYGVNDSERLEYLFIGDAETILVNDVQNGEMRMLPLGNFAPENEIGIPSVDELLKVVEAFPDTVYDNEDTDAAADTATDTATDTDTDEVMDTDTAAYIAPDTKTDADTDETVSEYSDCELKLVRTDSGNVYYIAFTHTELGIREEYYVSLEQCSVISSLTTLNGEPVYSYKQVRYSERIEDYSDDTLYAMRITSEAE